MARLAQLKKTPRAAAKAEIFSVQGISKVYDMGEVKVPALESVDLNLYAGEFVVLLGASGSGKSTLLNILGGLDTPTSGRVLFRDKDISQMSEDELTEFRRHHIGFVFQFYNLIPSLTAEENIALVTDIVSDPMPPAEAMRLVNLADRLGHFPAQLSGGEQQRVAIARAIAKKPDVLLCDEPTGALDFKTGRVVLEAIDTVNESLGTTTVIITHNAAIADMADRVIELRDGRLVSDRRNKRRKKVAELSW
ncbi:ABC transporter ATP-binding protein [Turneriella parva]|uniref:ABC transporter related protein n=1 Tax=Turneriella parva (strain ATCC BAA-1111 / DSM 21527 / NCTC 11395 / H) TaxID=869212 RepID=I4B5I0_TURPD|nr:ABC transporter related protein [Turneriella parva DSM 21527]